MKFVLILTTVLSIFFSSTVPSKAENFDALWDQFDVTHASRGDIWFLQAALAFKGYYHGLLDGHWGAISQRALQNYSYEEFQSSPQRWHAGTLAFDLWEQFEKDGWDISYNDPMGLSYLFPLGAIKEGERSDIFVNWEHIGNSLSYSMAITDRAKASSFHEYTAKQHASHRDLYTVRKTNFAVTSSITSDGTTIYTRSNYVNGSWSTIILSAATRDKNILNAVSASISVGDNSYIRVTPNGWLDETIDLAVAFLETLPEDENGHDLHTEQSLGVSSGTGFYVSRDGNVLTNAHVVSNCESITVDGNAAKLVALSNQFDLALLRVAARNNSRPAAFANTPAKLNADITVAGYPLNSLLGGLNVTRGSVSSTKGLMGDSITMQISAPIQPGNSGGPVLDATGSIVGVVVSKLDALAVADIVGDIPQNINFAIRGEIAKLFLYQNGVEPKTATKSDIMQPEELATYSKSITTYIECIPAN